MLSRAVKFLIQFLALAITLAVLAWLLPAFTIRNFWSAIAGAAVLLLLSTFLRPLLVRLTMPLNAITMGAFSLLISIFIVWLTAWILPGVEIRGILAPLVIVVVLTLVNTFTESILFSKEDRQLREYNRIKRFSRKIQNKGDVTKPGLIILEIDGLSEPVLHKAIEDGYMPHFAEWLKSGKYKAVRWDSGLPSQTSAMQAGILHGTHRNIPAFRYFDKEKQRLFVSGSGKDAGEMIGPLLNGQGILSNDGFSVNNWAFGDAPAVVMTFTTMSSKELGASAQADNLYSYFADVRNLPRTIGAAIHEIWVEWREARYQRKNANRPLIHRGGIYFFMRAGTNAFLPDLSRSLIVTKMFEGVSAVYSTFLAYDEVAHHSGCLDRDVWPVLTQIDEQFAWIVDAAKQTERPYEFVFLSDHGQSPGITFKQRYGFGLKDLVNSLLTPEYQAVITSGGDSGVGNVNMMLTSIIQSEGLLARPVRALVKGHTVAGVVDMTTDEEQKLDPKVDAKTVVCASGNLALIYFANQPGRLTLERIAELFPGFIEGIVAHEGVGFVLVRSEQKGGVVIGKNGIYYLDTDTIEGENPLQNFEPTAARHLKELDSYDNVGDIVANSFFDPKTGEVAPFEELNGTHGGLGGWQNRPFLMYPSFLEPEGGMQEIVGAPGVYKYLRQWVVQLQQPETPPAAIPAAQPGTQDGEQPAAQSPTAQPA
jgi:uncharacterized membrane protein YvlD (DUF360 family)